jgi:hypothetical protein
MARGENVERKKERKKKRPLKELRTGNTETHVYRKRASLLQRGFKTGKEQSRIRHAHSYPKGNGRSNVSLLI